MPLLADRVRETTTTTGQGTLTLDGAPSGFRTFTGAFGNGASVYYVIAGPSEWEIGFGTTGAGTLTRDTVLVSSAGGTTKVTFSAGTKDVFCSYVADRAVTTSDAATLTNKTIDDYTNNVGANATHFRVKASGTLTKGAVVKAVGFTPGEQAIEVAATSSASDVAIGFMEQALTTGQFGMAVVIGELFDVNTNGLAVGATLYSNNAGSYTTTKPSSGFYQSLGWVVRANLNNGVIAVNVVAPLYVETSTNTANTAVLRDGSGNFAAGTITQTTGLFGNGTVGAPALAASADTNTGMYFPAADTLGFVTGGTEDWRISSTGHFLAATDTSFDIGASGANRPRDLFLGRNATVAGNLTVDTNTLFVDATNNRVGVGVTSTIAQLCNTTTSDSITGVQPTGFVWRSTDNDWAAAIISRPASGLSYGLRVHSGGTTASDYPLWISSGASTGTQLLVVNGAGNLGLGTTSFGTSAAKVFAIGNGTEPSTGPADTVQFFSVDRSAGNTIPGFRCEGTGVTDAGITDTTVTHKIAMKINGTVYYLLATTNAT